MGTVIYSASPLQTFFSTWGSTALLVGLGIYGFASAVFQRNQKLLSRLGWGAAGALLLVVGGLSGLSMVKSISQPTQSVVMNLQRKRIAQDNCNDGQTCTRYVLETHNSATEFDFNVPKQAYDAAQENTCYRFTYYPNTGTFGFSTASFQSLDNLTRIETADPARCR